MASPPLDSDSVAVSTKRSRASYLHNDSGSTERFLSDSYGAGNKRPCQIYPRQPNHRSSPSSSSSSCFQSSCVSVCASPPTEEVDGILGEESPAVLQTVEWGVTTSAQTADSTTGSSFFSASPRVDEVNHSHTFRPAQSLQRLRRTLSQEAESCCDGEENQVDINCFFREGWEDTNDAAGGLGFDPATVFHSDAGLPEDCFVDAAFAGCAAENGNWFLNDLESESNTFWNEVLDQEWMAAAVASLDKINDTLDADSCMLHFLESGAGI